MAEPLRQPHIICLIIDKQPEIHRRYIIAQDCLISTGAKDKNSISPKAKLCSPHQVPCPVGNTEVLLRVEIAVCEIVLY